MTAPTWAVEKAREIVEDQVSGTGYVGSRDWLRTRIAAALVESAEDAARKTRHEMRELAEQARAEGREEHHDNCAVCGLSLEQTREEAGEYQTADLDAARAEGIEEGLEKAARKMEGEGQPGYAIEIRALRGKERS